MNRVVCGAVSEVRHGESVVSEENVNFGVEIGILSFAKKCTPLFPFPTCLPSDRDGGSFISDFHSGKFCTRFS